MKTKWSIIGILSFITIILFGSGAAPLIFSQVVYGCNLERMLATKDIDQVSNHPIISVYYDKYELYSTSTSSGRSLEWGYGTVEYSSYYSTLSDGWSSAYLKVILDQCGIPQEFEFKCIDSEDNAWVSLNSKNDDLLEYLQYDDCFSGKK